MSFRPEKRKMESDHRKEDEKEDFGDQQHKLNNRKRKAAEVVSRYPDAKKALEDLIDFDLFFGISRDVLVKRWTDLNPVMQSYKDLYKEIEYVSDNPDDLLRSQSVDWSQQCQTAERCEEKIVQFLQKDLKDALHDYYIHGREDYEEIVTTNISSDPEIAQLKQRLEPLTKPDSDFLRLLNSLENEESRLAVFNDLKQLSQGINQLRKFYGDNPKEVIDQRKKEVQEFYGDNSNKMLDWYFTEKRDSDLRAKQCFTQLISIDEVSLKKVKEDAKGLMNQEQAAMDVLMLNNKKSSPQFQTHLNNYGHCEDLHSACHQILNAKNTLQRKKIRSDVLVRGVLEEKDAEQFFNQLLLNAKRFSNRTSIKNLYTNHLLTIKRSLNTTTMTDLTSDEGNNAGSSSNTGD